MSENKRQDITNEHGSPEPDKLKPSNSLSSQREIGGPKGPEPTRYGDWEKNGRCSDF